MALTVLIALLVGIGVVRARDEPARLASDAAGEWPARARLLPANTAGTRLSFTVTLPDLESDEYRSVKPELRGMAAQLWERDGSVVFGIASSGFGGFGHDGAVAEHVDIATWPDATLLSRPDGSFSLMLWDGTQMHELVARGLGRAELLKITERVTTRPDRLGADLPAAALPDGLRKRSESTSSIHGVFLQYGTGDNTDPRSMRIALRLQTDEMVELERLWNPASSTIDIDGATADVDLLREGTTGRVRFTPAPGVHAVIEASTGLGITASAESVDMAIQIARSLRTVDEQSWNEALAKGLEDGPDGASTDTTVAPDLQPQGS